MEKGGQGIIVYERKKILCMAGNRNSSSSEKIRQKIMAFEELDKK